MKTIIRKSIMAVICLIAGTVTTFADNGTPVKVSQLPTEAQQTIKSHFADKKVAMANEEGFIYKEYKVIFTTGEKIEFDRKGKWTEINCRRNAVPAKLVPAKIASYVKTNMAGKKIVKMERDISKGTYEVELEDDTEIKFNKNGNVIKFDR